MLGITKTKTTRAIITGLNLVLILILLYIFIGRQISNYSERIKSNLFSQSQKIKEYEDLIRAYPNPEKEIELIEKKIQELKDKAASREQLPRIIQQLVHKTGELNINVISIKPLEDMKVSADKLFQGVSKVYIELEMLAPYQVISDYLKVLTELPIILTVESLTIEKKKEAFVSLSPAKVNELLVTLLLSAYMILEI